MARESRDFESHWERRRAGTKTLGVIEDFDFVVKVHFLGTAYVTHAAWPIMRAKAYGQPGNTGAGQQRRNVDVEDGEHLHDSHKDNQEYPGAVDNTSNSAYLLYARRARRALR